MNQGNELSTLAYNINQYIDTEYTIIALVFFTCVSFLLSLIALKRKKTIVASRPTINTSDSQHLFDSVQAQIREQEQKIVSLNKKMTEQEKLLPRTSIIKYNPFRDSGVGGNQSFSLATVDAHGNGAIITHLFSREMSRVQAKQISAWQSDTELSPEEKQVLEQIER